MVLAKHDDISGKCLFLKHLQGFFEMPSFHSQPTLLILGTRGVPASHGGFETFAERLALFLVHKGWKVGVYCQEEVDKVTQRIRSHSWNGIEQIVVQVSSKGPRATLDFDWHCVAHAAKQHAVCLVLGYNGAIFLPYLRLHQKAVITNMDGIEWRRPKWSLPIKAWFLLNEWVAAWSSHKMVADHPRIADHLATRRDRSRAVMIPYGGEPVFHAMEAPVRALGLEPDRYLISIARIEPDNSILDIVEAFARKPRNIKLVVLGKFMPGNAYHEKIRAFESSNILFPGAIYETETVQALRFHARAYMHGHTAGGTNPSLVEALWAGNAVIAHDNRYNRWTADGAGLFFKTIDECSQCIDAIDCASANLEEYRRQARKRAELTFNWPEVLNRYEQELLILDAGHRKNQPYLEAAE